MDRLKVLWFLVLLGMPVSAEGTVFRWQVIDKVRYKILSYVYEEAYRNSIFQHKVEIRHKALLDTVEVKSNAGRYKGDFHYYQRKIGATNLPFQLKEVYPTDFWRDNLGQYSMDRDMYMPVVRNVPVFPVSNIEPGTIWTAPGYEVHDLKQYGITNAYRFPMNVRYIYVGDEVIGGRKIAKFSVTYIFSHLGDYDYDARVQRARQLLDHYRQSDPANYYRYRQILENRLQVLGMAPKRIFGSSIQLYYWDIEAGVPLKVDEDFHFIFHLFNGYVDEYKGYSRNSFHVVTPLKDSGTLVKKLEDKKLKGVTIKKDKRGIVLHFDDILFDFRRHDLKPEARDQILKIGDILRQYGRFDIRVEGHTDNIGDDAYNLDLSKKRAHAVARFFSTKMGVDGKRLSWIGYGKGRPTADNNTPEGRRRNRRVEVVILTNE